MKNGQALDLLLVEPPQGSIVRLRVAYPDSPKVYTYALVEAGMRWYVTGMSSDPVMTWADIVRWLELRHAELVSIEMATAWEGLL